MAFFFGDSFDLYAAFADMFPTYWDSNPIGGGGVNFVAGRFSGSRAIQLVGGSNSNGWVAKSSGSNDAVHHLVVAINYTATMSGTTAWNWFTFYDGTNAQCSIVFRSDGAVLLTSGLYNGATLATYTGAVAAQNTWYAFEFEVVINNTSGSFTARKNGNTTADFTLGSLNTRAGSTNNYANRFAIGINTATAISVDDLLWRSDAASVPWVGDIRCYTRMPASDASVQFSKSITTSSQGQGSVTTATINTPQARYSPFTALYDGTVGTVVLNLNTGYTGNMKCSIFAGTSSTVTTVLASATPINNPVTGLNTFTFSTPLAVTKGTLYWVGFDSDTGGVSNGWSVGTGSGGTTSATPYASFPSANPGLTTGQPPINCTFNITIGSNATLVAEPQQDGATSYVQSSTTGQSDLYGIAAAGGSPSSIVGVTTRGFFQKGDAGTRNAAVQLKSGSSTVTSASTALATSFGWLWRTDTVDPATSAAWTATGVNNAQIGPVVTA